LSSPTQDLYAVGKVVKAYGIKGEIVVRPLTDSPGRFKSIHRLYVGRSSEAVHESSVEWVMVQPRGVRMKLAAVNDRNAAERLIDSLLFVDEQTRMRPPRGTYFAHDLLGLRVVDQDGREIGTVTDVLKHSAHDIYVIDAQGREVMVPAVKEFISAIDLNSRTMRVKLIEGMLE